MTEIWFDNFFMRVLLDAESTGGNLSVCEQWHYKGYAPPMHVHHKEDQTLHVLEGSITARLGEEDRVVSSGESVFLPRGVPHCFLVEEEGTRLLEINTPGGFEGFHIAAGEPATEARLPDRADPDIGRLVAAAGPYECEILGPPMT